MKLARSNLEPVPAARSQRQRFFDFHQLQQAAEESARLSLTTLGSGYLHVVDVRHEHAYR